MPLYVDIAAVRIQQYLSRTPTLRGRRGASAALASAHDVLADKDLLAGRARVNGEAGQVDGVLSIVLDDEASREVVVDTLLSRLRDELPGAEFQVAWGRADSYLVAYMREIKPMVERGEAQVDLPASAEFPLAAACQICRMDPAIDEAIINFEDGQQHLCADCVMRYAPRNRRRVRTAEERLAERVGATKSPQGFNDLAALGTAGDGTHVATLHLDGNRVGGFFAELAGLGGVDRSGAVKALTDATFHALAAATCAVRRPDDAALCVVPYLLGGDDVLVSMPADRAWRFVIEFLTDFGARTGRLARRLGMSETSAPTTAAGMVFARRDFPFALMVEETEWCLRDAKGIGAGLRPWVRFVDITSDGPGGGCRPVSLTALRRHRSALTALVKLPRAHRARLVETLHSDGPDTTRTLAARLGHTAVIKPFSIPGGQHGDGNATERDEDVIDMDQALRIARWWQR